MRAIIPALVKATKVLLRCFATVLVVKLLIVGVVVGSFAAIVWWDYVSAPTFREGVRVKASQVPFVRRELLSPRVPIEIGYAETGEGCHTASGALLLRSHKVRRVLTTIDVPVCSSRTEDEVLRSIPNDRFPTRAIFETSAFWLERAEYGVDQSSGDMAERSFEAQTTEGLVRIVEGDPWPQGFLINCSRDRSRYSLRALMPDPAFGGSRFGEVATVGFWRGTCMDERHWPKIDALVDLIWVLQDYRPDGT